MFRRKDVCRIQEKHDVKKKPLTVILLILMSAFLLMPNSMVMGQVDVSISFASAQGVVGQDINLQGTIVTTNGDYQIWIGDKLVVSNSSEGYYVTARFAVPALPTGTYTLTLRDVSKNVNATQSFTVLLGYNIEALIPSSPAQLQEGSNVVLNVTLTGATSGVTYYANVTVELPAPLNASYSRVVGLSASSQAAVVSAQVTFPDTTFEPSGSFANYTGSYQVYFNKTQLLAQDQFSVGFTDLSEYHRDQSVNIRAMGYQPDENATIAIIYAETGAIVHSEKVTASSGGIVTSVWVVPSNALIGDYNITITPENTPKLVPDSQLFIVPGYLVKVRTLNLAGSHVSPVEIDAFDQATNTIVSDTSGGDGLASLNLERGNYTISAFWNDVQVGEMNASITGDTTFDLSCALVNLKITVQDKNGNLIPFVNLGIIYSYVTTKGSLSKTGSASGQTDISGSFTLNSALPTISYTIDASLYGVVFNAGNNTVSSLSVQPISEVTILCPSRILTLKVVDYNLVAIPNAQIELIELTGGLFYGGVTDSSGTVTLEVTFGKYRIRIYADNVLLNETLVEVFSDTQNEIRCTLYNIQVSVTVVDYLEQPIPNANVVLKGIGIGTRSATTQTDGTSTFSNVVGGDLQIIAYPPEMGSAYEALNLRIEEPTVVRIKMAKFVLLGPFLIESSVLATLLLILAAILLFVSIEIYKKKRAKPAGES
jgi:hypothetical protein